MCAHVANVTNMSPSKLFSAGNDMDPGRVPACLLEMTVEEMLIARANPIMCLYRKHGGQRGYRGHVPQDIQRFLDHLPVNVINYQSYLFVALMMTVCIWILESDVPKYLVTI